MAHKHGLDALAPPLDPVSGARRMKLRFAAAAALATTALYVLWTAFSPAAHADEFASMPPLNATVYELSEDAVHAPLALDADTHLIPDSDTADTSPSTPAAPAAPTPGPRISIVVIWEGGVPFSSLSNFFASIGANAPLVELVWIGVRHDEDDMCLDIGPLVPAPAAASIRKVCLTQRQYWAKHADYFCQRWACSDAERASTLDAFMDRNDKDRNKSIYRIWRGFIFREYMHPAAEWWGWADVDTFMGSFESMFPWDVAPAFDVLIPAHPDLLLYLRGHLAFIQTRAETEEKMNLYENMRTREGFIERHKDAFWCAEEAEFSAFVVRDPRIAFLTVPTHLTALGWPERRPDTAVFASLGGTFTLAAPNAERLPVFPSFPLLRVPAPSDRGGDAARFVPTFSSDGVMSPVQLRTDRAADSVWFPPEFATYYEPAPAPGGWEDPARGREIIRYVGRGGGFEGGPEGVWERIERDREPVEARVLDGVDQGAPWDETDEQKDRRRTVPLREGLYIHWMHFKYDYPVFRALPALPLEPHEALAHFYTDGAEIWDVAHGQVVWRGGDMHRAGTGAGTEMVRRSDPASDGAEPDGGVEKRGDGVAGAKARHHRRLMRAGHASRMSFVEG